MELRTCKICGPINCDQFYRTDERGYYGSRCKACTIKQVTERYDRRKDSEPLQLWAETTCSRKTSCFKLGLNDREFTLSVDDLLKLWHDSSGACVYCGVEIDLKRGKGIHNNSPSLDRIDNTIGYNLKNVVLSCFACNTIKGKFGADELETRVSMIVKKIREYSSR